MVEAWEVVELERDLVLTEGVLERERVFLVARGISSSDISSVVVRVSSSGVWLEVLESCVCGPSGWPHGRLLSGGLGWAGLGEEFLWLLKEGGVGEGGVCVRDSLEKPEYWVFGGVGGGSGDWEGWWPWPGGKDAGDSDSWRWREGVSGVVWAAAAAGVVVVVGVGVVGAVVEAEAVAEAVVDAVAGVEAVVDVVVIVADVGEAAAGGLAACAMG